MGIKVKAIERNVAFDKKSEKWAYVMQPELYGQLDQEKVIDQAAKESGLQKPVLKACINAYSEVVKTWATEGHSIPIPGLGTMRFGLRSTAVDSVDQVSAALITRRHVIFTPNVDIKDALAKTSVSITCYDRNGKVVKQVTSDDKDDIENPDDADSKGDSTNGSTDKGDSGKDNTGSTPGTGDDGDGDLDLG